MAFIRWSGVRPLIDALRRHCEAGKPLRVLTTTYTNSTEQRALDELRAARRADQGLVRHDVDATAREGWIFHRESGYSTAYIGSSNLTHSAQVLGLEWNVRVSGGRNPDAVAKMAAVFESYWESSDFVAYDAGGVRATHAGARRAPTSRCSARSRSSSGRSRRRCSSRSSSPATRATIATCSSRPPGPGKTVMAAVDYARLRAELGAQPTPVRRSPRGDPRPEPRDVPARACATRAFGEKWVGGQRPQRFEHVFASIQSLNAPTFATSTRRTSTS